MTTADVDDICSACCPVEPGRARSYRVHEGSRTCTAGRREKWSYGTELWLRFLLAWAYHSVSISNSLAADEDFRATDAGVFKSADLNADGKVSRREIIHFSDLVFLSMDTDNDDVLTVEEFLQWDPGYAAIAEKRGRTAQLNAAKRDLYKLADLNGDGTLDHDEFSVASLYDFYKADVNHDRTLSEEEFVGEYRILRVSRSAIE